MTKKSLEELIEGYLRNSLSNEELAYFIQLVQQNKVDAHLREYVDQLLAASTRVDPMVGQRSAAEKELAFQHIVATASVVPMQRRFPVYRLAGIAACVLLAIAGIGTWFYMRRTSKQELPAIAVSKIVPPRPVTAGSTKATLTLADGSVVALDEAKNGELARQGGSKVVKVNGKLEYNPSTTGSTAVLYNTISTPRGGQYKVALADGTLVWLNAASSLHFPTAFTQMQRSVEITGEAYLEVAQNKDKPFVVVVNGSRIEVLGTSFNVSAYDDEKQLTTTLLEGSVRFVNGSSTTLLVPGQQSRHFNGRTKVVDNVDVNAVVAWKNGMFHFENATIETVMKQLARWYDVELVYENNEQRLQNKTMGDMLHADIPRDTRLSDVLKVLEIACKTKFELDDKKIIIKR